MLFSRQVGQKGCEQKKKREGSRKEVSIFVGEVLVDEKHLKEKLSRD